jgi:hypothetical protein
MGGSHWWEIASMVCGYCYKIASMGGYFILNHIYWRKSSEVRQK